MGWNLLKRLQLQEDKPLGGRYQITAQLGAGGFGQTFLAQDLHLPGHPICVIKQLKPQATDTATLQTARRLFETEAQVLYQLGIHDQIPRLLAHFEDQQEFYLAQEYIEGAPLNEELVPRQPWSESRAIALLKGILTPLAFVHQQRVIHRDLKPSNLIRRQCDGAIVLIDFGAVKQASTQLVNPHSGPTQTISIGTYGYMANEQIAGNPRFSSDVYAVGKIGIQALTGRLPRELTEDCRTGEVEWHAHAPDIHPDLRDVLDRMVRYDFRDRYPTASEALDALNALQIQEALDGDGDETAIAPVAASLPTETLAPPNRPTPPESLSATLPWSNAALPVETQATLPVATPLAQSPRSPLPTANPALRRSGAIAAPAAPRGPQRPGLPLVAASAAVLVLGGLGLRAVWAPSTAPQTAGANPTAPAAPAPSPQAPDPAPTPDLAARAVALQQEGNYQQAVDLYQQAIAQNSQSPQVYAGQCFSLNKLQRYEQAIAACDQALALNPDHAEAVWSKGYALEQQEQYSQALNLYERAIQLDEGFAAAWNNRGTALLRLEQGAAAVEAFDRAIALDPKFAEAWSNRGAALWSLRRFDDAIASIDQAIQLQPDDPAALSLREQMRDQLGR